MHALLQQLTDGLAFSGQVAEDAPRFLHHHGLPKTAAHVADVAAEAGRLAQCFGADPQGAEIAGWLHDISAVFPSPQRAEVARQLGVEVLPEEDAFPMIIHQKLSVVIAREVFGVDDAATLSAIGCHTTLKRDAGLLDMAVFVADKIAWDQGGTPPYLDAVMVGLGQSIEAAALAYLRYLWERRETLPVVHPWARDAYAQLSGEDV